MSNAQWIKKNLKDGEHYAGVILGKGGALDHHLVLLADEAEKVTWSEAHEWVKKGVGLLPTRREQALLYANLKEQFKETWYWSSEQLSADSGSAWSQNFTSGNQDCNGLGYELRARTVRRVTCFWDGSFK